jgi:hypothetical protein
VSRRPPVVEILACVLIVATLLAEGAAGLPAAGAETAASAPPAPPSIAAVLATLEPGATTSPTPQPSPFADPSSTAGSTTDGYIDPLTDEADLPPPGFLVGDWKLKDIRWRHLRYNGGSLVPVETVGPHDDKGVPLAPLGPGGSLVYNPTIIAQQGMKRLDAYHRTGQKVYLRQARKYANLLTRISDGGKQRRWQPHPYAMGVHKPGWVNSNSHGLVLSFLSRFYDLTGARRRLKEAGRLMAAFENRPDNQRWFSNVTGGGYLWFEHWPNGTHDHTLNAHLNAMFGLYDYWRATGSALAREYFLGGARTVRDKLYRFRRKGELSRYSMSSKEGSVHYHVTHILQLRILAQMTGDDWFDRQADLFARDLAKWRAKYRGAKG